MGKYSFYINSLTFFGFRVLLVLGVFLYRAKGWGGGRLTKMLPGRQTHFREFFWEPFGENTFSKVHPKINRSFLKNMLYFDNAVWNLGNLFNEHNRTWGVCPTEKSFRVMLCSHAVGYHWWYFCQDGRWSLYLTLWLRRFSTWPCEIMWSLSLPINIFSTVSLVHIIYKWFLCFIWLPWDNSYDS